MTARRRSRWWVPIPAWSLAVRWCCDAESELDALEHAVLSLLRNEPRTIEALVELLGVGDDVVLSALLDLSDRGLVSDPDHIAGDWSAPGGESPPGAELQSGYASVTVLGDVRAVPQITRKRPRLDPSPSEDDPSLDAALVQDVSIDRPTPEQVERALGLAVSRGSVACPPDSRSFARTPSGPASMVRLDRLDPDVARARWMRVVVWSAVDVLPGLGVDATLVFHEPVPLPDDNAETPVLPTIHDWIRARAPELHAELDRRVRALAVSASVVLTAAGLTSIEALDAAVQEHRRELARRIGVHLPSTWHSDLSIVVQRVDEASRWLLAARHEPRCRDALARSQAAAVEALAQSLWAVVRDTLREWANLWRARLATGLSKLELRQRFHEEAAQRRLVDLGLSGLLGPSAAHLIRATQEITQTLKSIDRNDAGAGSSVTLWLLPLTLLEATVARAHAAQVRAALAVDAHLFDHLDALIEARNIIVHDREADEAALARRPEDLEAMLLRAVVAVGTSKDNAAP